MHRTAWLHDLRWLLLSPPLLSTTPGVFSAVVQQFDDDERHAIEAWLRELADEPNRWPAWAADSVTAAHPARLGRYAEQLLQYFLQEGPTHRAVASHLPVRQATKQGGVVTLGEIDFLVEDRGGQRWHWELAVKFFVCTAAPSTPISLEHYVGPQGNDSLVRKLDKLFVKQLHCAPPAPWDLHSWQPAAVVRGCLFYPPGDVAVVPAELNPGHLRGLWISADQQARLPAQGQWQSVPPWHWMAPRWDAALALTAAQWHDQHQLTGPRPVMWAQPGADGEPQRCLILPTDSPILGTARSGP